MTPCLREGRAGPSAPRCPFLSAKPPLRGRLSLALPPPFPTGVVPGVYPPSDLRAPSDAGPECRAAPGPVQGLLPRRWHSARPRAQRDRPGAPPPTLDRASARDLRPQAPSPSPGPPLPARLRGRAWGGGGLLVTVCPAGEGAGPGCVIVGPGGQGGGRGGSGRPSAHASSPTPPPPATCLTSLRGGGGQSHAPDLAGPFGAARAHPPPQSTPPPLSPRPSLCPLPRPSGPRAPCVFVGPGPSGGGACPPPPARCVAL